MNVQTSLLSYRGTSNLQFCNINMTFSPSPITFCIHEISCSKICLKHVLPLSLVMSCIHFQGEQRSMTNLRSLWKLKALCSVNWSRSTGHIHRTTLFRRLCRLCVFSCSLAAAFQERCLPQRKRKMNSMLHSSE